MFVRLLAGVIVAATLSAAPHTAGAASITFTEEFILPDLPFPPGFGGQAFYVGTDPGAGLCDLGTLTCVRTFATVLFDLSATPAGNPANVATLLSETIDLGFNRVGGPFVEGTHAPDTDASGYVAGTGIASASLTLGIRGLDLDNDNVLVQAFAVDGAGVLHQNTYLGSLTSTSLVINLDATLRALLAADGQLGIVFTSFGTDLFTHDFNVESARLEATVPEPATVVLLMGGLAASAWRRRRRHVAREHVRMAERSTGCATSSPAASRLSPNPSSARPPIRW